jgi:hypothetical protein
VSGASNFLDPVEAAQDEISRSKRMIASALEDLTQHHSWLESYHRDERRRAQRLRRQEALEALELRRQRAAWMTWRFALASFAVMRATANFLARNAAAFLTWASPRAQALALLLATELSAASAWSWRTGRFLARKGYAGAVIGFTWTVHTSDALGVAFRKRASTGAARIYAEAATRARPILQPAFKRASASWTRARARSMRLARTMQTRASDGWSRMRSTAPIRARNAVVATSEGYARLADRAAVVNARGRDQLSSTFAWTRARSQDVARAGVRTASETWRWVALQTRHIVERRISSQKALIVRQCTALVCIEPRRTRLPVVRV